MTYLYQIPRNSKIYEKVNDGSSYVVFNHLDGMYSYCTTENGNVVHLAGHQPLRKCKDGYKLAKEKNG